ncbi:hypothetical protein SSX86_025219 [Deinandra increscens subsp. villosa]|uniref:Uncharacterized protein n=1 Tax=Deinandra increscens subsp. villosa TaxID=3103831 RepID=A0AAP0CI50_9ASTR
MEKIKTPKPSIAIRVLKAPVRVVSKIRDLYISSMHSCASGMGGPTGAYASAGLPRSCSTTSSRAEEDYAELMRFNSTKRLFLAAQQQAPVVPRSQSVAIGRIDEDQSVDFGADFRLNSEMFPRSRSHAVTSRIYA